MLDKAGELVKGLAVGIANSFIAPGENMTGSVWDIGGRTPKEINNGNSFQFSEEGSGTFATGVFIGGMIAPGPGGKTKGAINITEKGLEHVVERHTVNGLAKFVAKSKFNASENLSSLINQASQHVPVPQGNGNLARTFNVGHDIGIDRVSGKQTSTMTVITRSNGDLVTAFPGHP
ncbi:MAG: hypothetical protein Q7T25_10670 [Sideroxyarcus sp.]|nr:hypothetical protein [Sideroxyarcus sp.]